MVLVVVVVGPTTQHILKDHKQLSDEATKMSPLDYHQARRKLLIRGNIACLVKLRLMAKSDKIGKAGQSVR